MGGDLTNAATEQLDSIMENNMGLVVLVAKSFNPQNEEQLDEFVQLGRIGMWKAIKKYDPSRAKLSTLIWLYVRWEILRHLKKNNKKEIQMDENLYLEDNLIIDSYFWEYLPEQLTYNEKSVINLRLQGHTFFEIGKELGYSRGWANNTFKTAISKIKNGNEKKKEENTHSK